MAKTMARKQKSAFERAVRKWARERYDRLLDSFDAGEFVEVVVTMGGDVMTYRVYNDHGKINEDMIYAR